MEKTSTQQDELSHLDSVSVVSKSTVSTSESACSCMSSASSAHLKEEASRAALGAKAAAQKKKERKKALTLKKAQLVAEKDQLKIQTALAVSNAKSEVYEDYDISEASCGMNSYSCQIKGVNTRRVNSCLCGSHSACGPKEDPWYGVSSIINNIEIMKMSSIMS